MKIFRYPLGFILISLFTSCIPGKFASGIEGVIVDRKSSNPVSGAKLESRIPLRDGATDLACESTFTDSKGRFSFPCVVRIYTPLMMAGDWREVVVYKDGYAPTRVSIYHREGVMSVEAADGRDFEAIHSPEILRLKIAKTKEEF